MKINSARCFIKIVVVALGHFTSSLHEAHAETRLCSSDWLRFEPSLVSLSGTIRREEFFGPPNYGEDKLHDKKESVHLLKLDIGINVAAESGSAFNDQTLKCQTVIQVLLPSKFRFSDRLGKVKVSGTISAGHTGHDRTNLVLNAREIQALR